NPIGSDFVNFSITAPAVFSDNTRLSRSALDAAGVAPIGVTSGTAGKATVHATAANVADSMLITFTTNNLSVASAKTSLVIGGRDSTQVSARYLDMSGNPLAGKTITFATNAGSLTAQSAVTGGNGVATTCLKSGSFAAEATVQAKSPDGSAYTTVLFRAAAAASVALAITPDNIGVNGGVAALIATVKDDSGNVVSGAEVSFRILNGPGGGERIDRPIIVSTNDGIARTQLLAGSLPSTYRGCEVEANVAGVIASSKLTISGEPHTVTVSRPEDDTVKVPNGGHMDESTFEFFIGAVVQDVNGNPVADGTPVNFSAVVSGMAVMVKHFERWETKEGDVKPIVEYVYYDIPFEDINGNFRFDPGIDLDLDVYPLAASRGNDRDGDGVFEYDILTDGFFWDFNGNGICDTSSSEFNGEPYYGALKVTTEGDTVPDFYADLNANGRWDRYEWTGDARSTLPPAAFTTPLGFDFEFWRWEVRKQFRGQRLDFIDNDFAVVIDRTAVTTNGVARTQLTYPRQFAQRLIATVNAEVKGIRDRDGERFRLPVVQ
ncbi:MAG: Ig-like domain-containing protein, partial [Chitinispirillaceae bacterium]|nr:Ig-like domain-containing protein [Chitinispirillaceae bacterium]